MRTLSAWILEAALTGLRAQILTSATTLGALLAGFSSGVLVRCVSSYSQSVYSLPPIQADIIGRKLVIAVADVIFIVGAGAFPSRSLYPCSF